MTDPARQGEELIALAIGRTPEQLEEQLELGGRELGLEGEEGFEPGDAGAAPALGRA